MQRQRPPTFRINRRAPLANGLVFAGLGGGASTLLYADASGYCSLCVPWWSALAQWCADLRCRPGRWWRLRRRAAMYERMMGGGYRGVA